MAVIPERSLSVNVDINVVGIGGNAHEKEGVKVSE